MAAESKWPDEIALATARRVCLVARKADVDTLTCRTWDAVESG
jgi:hypothetical protein